MTGGQVPLWRQLQQVAQVVHKVRAGRSAGLALGEVHAGLRPGVQSLSYAVLRRLGAAVALRKRLADRVPAPGVDALLCSALALASRPEGSGYDTHTLVNQAVEAAKRDGTMAKQAGFVNACLRRFLRESAALMASIQHEPEARWGHPAWWIRRLQQAYPQQWESVLATDQQPGAMTLRVNTQHGSVTECLALLRAAGQEADINGKYGLTLKQALPVTELAGFADGWWSVQDAAAQLAAPLLLDGLGNTDGLEILDACAAPGGKTAHLLELARGRVTALDIDASRCASIQQTLQRLGLSARVITADAGDPAAWWPQLGSPLFDAILLDAPCTASGIVRRHPDIPWLRRESDIAQLAQVQARLLNALWPLVKQGGRLLYCTCSIFPEEGARQVEAFVANNSDARLRASPGHLLPQTAGKDGDLRDNWSGDHDGFFYGLLEKLVR